MGIRREKRQVKKEKNNSEMVTGRLKRSRMENRGHKAVPLRWLRGMQDGHY